MEILLISGGMLALYMSALFAVSLVTKNNGVADIGYGIAFIVVVGTAFFLSTEKSWQAGLLALLSFIWGLRLATRIYLKNKGKPEDFRYRAWRESWGSIFIFRSFLQIYMLQGCIVFIVALPVTLAIAFPSHNIGVAHLALGVILWLIGFLFEVCGDYQLDAFIKDQKNKGRIMMSGLWHYSRHPNYFVESMMWWGIALVGSGLSQFPILVFVSPVLITFLLLKVSGVPMLEKRWAGNPEWEAYKARTSVFFPLPPQAVVPVDK